MSSPQDTCAPWDEGNDLGYLVRPIQTQQYGKASELIALHVTAAVRGTLGKTQARLPDVMPLHL
jgi:hypothetical protein